MSGPYDLSPIRKRAKKKSPQLPAKRTDKQTKMSEVGAILYRFHPSAKTSVALESLREILAIFGYEVEA